MSLGKGSTLLAVAVQGKHIPVSLGQGSTLFKCRQAKEAHCSSVVRHRAGAHFSTRDSPWRLMDYRTVGVLQQGGGREGDSGSPW